MAERSLSWPADSRVDLPVPRGDSHASGAREETRSVETVVVALIPEYHQVKVRDRDGHVYALTRKTAGVRLGDLHEGQQVLCTVTRRLPRVLSAALA
jgi:hypothetical protein